MEYVKSPFDPDEYEALARSAEIHIRPIPNEVRYIVREALEKAGLLPPRIERRQPAQAAS